MTLLSPRVHAWWDGHHRHPRGLAGRLIGARMARQHRPETDWSIDLLAVASTDHVLELGFGAGRALGLLAHRTPAGFVTGIDVSHTMVAAARRRHAAAIAAGRMAVLQGDAADLPVAPATFDKLLTIHTYYFWPDPLDTLAQLVRLLRPGGRLVVTLSTGVVGADGSRTPGPFGPLHTFLEQQAVPRLRHLGCTTAALVEGPDNRQYNSVALIAIT